MATGLKTSASEGAAQNAGGLRTIFDRFRTTKRPHREEDESKTNSNAAQDMPLTQDLNSRVQQSRKHDKNGGGAASNVVAPASAAVTKETSTPNFFTKLLRRQTKSKKQADRPRIRLVHTAPVLEQEFPAHNQNGLRHARPLQRTTANPALQSNPCGYSRIDAKINAGEDKRRSQVYVPSHAASDLARVPVSRSLKDRYSTLVDEEDCRHLSRMLAQVSPPPEVDGSRTYSYMSDDRDRDDQRRLTNTTLEGISNVDTDSSFGVEAGVDNTLQPPPAPARRQRNRHSYVLSGDHHQIVEEPEDTSDYQHFMKRALDRDRQEHAEAWRAISNQSGKKPINPMHSDLTNLCSLERADTFGKSKHNAYSSKMRESARRRASHYSYKSQDSRKRQSRTGGDFNFGPGVESPQKDPRNKTSAAKRVSDYFKPPRNVITGYEQPDNKRASRAGFF
jgi:hypothetical protein